MLNSLYFGPTKQSASIGLTYKHQYCLHYRHIFVFLAHQNANQVKSLLRRTAIWESKFCCTIYKHALLIIWFPFSWFHVLFFENPSWLWPTQRENTQRAETVPGAQGCLPSPGGRDSVACLVNPCSSYIKLRSYFIYFIIEVVLHLFSS